MKKEWSRVWSFVNALTLLVGWNPCHLSLEILFWSRWRKLRGLRGTGWPRFTFKIAVLNRDGGDVDILWISAIAEPLVKWRPSTFEQQIGLKDQQASSCQISSRLVKPEISQFNSFQNGGRRPRNLPTDNSSNVRFPILSKPTMPLCRLADGHGRKAGLDWKL